MKGPELILHRQVGNPDRIQFPPTISKREFGGICVNIKEAKKPLEFHALGHNPGKAAKRLVKLYLKTCTVDELGSVLTWAFDNYMERKKPLKFFRRLYYVVSDLQLNAAMKENHKAVESTVNAFKEFAVAAEQMKKPRIATEPEWEKPDHSARPPVQRPLCMDMPDLPGDADHLAALAEQRNREHHIPDYVTFSTAWSVAECLERTNWSFEQCMQRTGMEAWLRKREAEIERNCNREWKAPE